MTEAEWLASTDTRPLFKHLGRMATDRKLRLFNCACCWLIEQYITDQKSRDAIDSAERFADGLVTAAELANALSTAQAAQVETSRAFRPDSAVGLAARAVVGCLESPPHRHHVVDMAFYAAISEDVPDQSLVVDRQQATLFRDIFPFHPIALDPSWRTSTVIALAKQMYESRDFSAMPILADALQDVGCDIDDILNHCRGDGAHVRGCWVVDLVLGIR